MRQREAERAVAELAVVVAAMIFKPSRVRCVGVQVLRADVVVLAVDHAAKPGEEALGLVRAHFLEAERFAVVDPERLELGVQNVPMRCLVGVHSRSRRNHLGNRLDAIGVTETEKNLNNKIARGGFTAAFFIQCLTAIGAKDVRLE